MNDRVVDIAGRIDQAAGRPERDDHQRGAGSVSSGDDASHVFGGDGMNDAVDLRRNDQRRGLILRAEDKDGRGEQHDTGGER